MPDSKRYELVPSNTFIKELNKLSLKDKEKVLATLETLKVTPFYQSLRTKKIGKNYESSVNMDIRIIWRFRENRIIALLDVGHHDVLKKY